MSRKFAGGTIVSILVCVPSQPGGGAGGVRGPEEPQDERKAFHLPPGFEVQLVAAEPDIHKPINIAFDDRGRLWVTDTVEYPSPPRTASRRATPSRSSPTSAPTAAPARSRPSPTA